MDISSELKTAVEAAVKGAKQPSKVAVRLVAWLNEMGQRVLTREENSRHLENVRDAIETENDGADV